MKSPMQEFRDEAEKMSKKGGDAGFVGRSIISLMENLDSIEKEKESIEQAHMAGQADAGVDPSAFEAMVYFKSLK